MIFSMQKKIVTLGLALTILASLFSTAAPVQAAHGVPGSADFGIGVSLDPRTSFSSDGIRLAGSLNVDWVNLKFDWKANQPLMAQGIDFTQLDQVMLTALTHNQPVMISLTNPPEEARTSTGPDISAVSHLVITLAQRYAGVLQAVELFPAANTSAGWTAQPDPAAYAQLMAAVHQALTDNQLDLYLVAGGLQPLNHLANGDMDDLLFLQGLYAAGANQWMQILSLNLDNLSGEPLTPPFVTNHQVLRHYEEIRQVMLNNQHSAGLIWVTLINAPSGTIKSASTSGRDSNSRVRWYADAVSQLRSQLYIGVVFAAQLNPTENQADSLIQTDGSFGNYYVTFRNLIQQNNYLSSNSKPGRSKSDALLKIRN